MCSSPSTSKSSGACRIKIDLDLCQGHAVCVSEAPEVFDFDDEERKACLRMERPDPKLRAKVELATRHCPTRALKIKE